MRGYIDIKLEDHALEIEYDIDYPEFFIEAVRDANTDEYLDWKTWERLENDYWDIICQEIHEHYMTRYD